MPRILSWLLHSFVSWLIARWNARFVMTPVYHRNCQYYSVCTQSKRFKRDIEENQDFSQETINSRFFINMMEKS